MPSLIEWQHGVSSSGRPLLLVVAPEAGFRLTHMRTEIEVRGGPTADGSETWVDPLIGSRVRLGLSDRWGVAAEGNFGGFGVGSDFTWNLQAFVGYRTTLFGRDTTFALGYRALHQDYDHNDFEWDVTCMARSSEARCALSGSRDVHVGTLKRRVVDLERTWHRLGPAAPGT